MLLDQGPTGNRNCCSCQDACKGSSCHNRTPAFPTSAALCFVSLLGYLTWMCRNGSHSRLVNGFYPLSFHNSFIPVTVGRCKRNWSCGLDWVGDTLQGGLTSLPSVKWKENVGTHFVLCGQVPSSCSLWNDHAVYVFTEKERGGRNARKPQEIISLIPPRGENYLEKLIRGRPGSDLYYFLPKVFHSTTPLSLVCFQLSHLQSPAVSQNRNPDHVTPLLRHPFSDIYLLSKGIRCF